MLTAHLSLRLPGGRNRPSHRRVRSLSDSPSSRAGVTLVEMLISVTLTLMIVFAVVQIFQVLGDTVAVGRATIEMSGQLRSITSRLQRDIDSITCPVRPWLDPAAAAGYFHYYEGPENDRSNLRYRSGEVELADDANGIPLYHYRGDRDDRLAMTIQATGRPFRGYGYVNGTKMVVESQYAEVVWWLAEVPSGATPRGSRSLFRRVLLILPGLGNQPVSTNFRLNDHDISVNVNGIPNSLSSLTTPVNRVSSWADEFIDVIPANDSDNNPITNDHLEGRYGEYLIASNVEAFDIRAYDPDAPIIQLANTDLALSPGDLGYPGYPPASDVAPLVQVPDQLRRAKTINPTVTAQDRAVGYGAFVDLGYVVDKSSWNRRLSSTYSDLWQTPGVNQRISQFSGLPSYLDADPTDGNDFVRANDRFWTASPIQGDIVIPDTNAGGLIQVPGNEADASRMPNLFVYDTWSLGLERDGQDQDNDGLSDESVNGIDDDDIGGTDDYGERETRPPYDVALRGIEVRIRLIEENTGQVRQASIIGDFVPK